MPTTGSYKNFQEDFKIFTKKRSDIVVNTLSNIFTMRLIGNKTHGDLAEIGISEFIHQFMYNYDSRHVGKDLFRAKQHEEDIIIIDERTQTEIPVSLKAYGDGPLQLSTDKDNKMFPKLEEYGDKIESPDTIYEILNSSAFASIHSANVMPLIYRKKTTECNIMVFDFEKMKRDVARILRIGKDRAYNSETMQVEEAKRRKHPIYVFLNDEGKYICEVRYGGPAANALQRGLWTHTIHALPYFNSLTNGWISYSHNLTLVELFRLALNSTEAGHALANDLLQADIDKLRNKLR